MGRSAIKAIVITALAAAAGAGAWATLDAHRRATAPDPAVAYGERGRAHGAARLRELGTDRASFQGGGGSRPRGRGDRRA